MKLDNQSIAKRYGRAFFEVALQNGNLEEVYLELQALKQAFHAEPEVLAFFTSAKITDQAKRALLEGMTKDASKETTNLINMLYDYHRIVNLEDIIDEFNRLYDEHHKTVHISVTTAVPLDQGQLAKIGDKYQQVVDANKVIIDPIVDPAIIGGVILKSDHKIYDGSIKAKLEHIRRLLLK